MLNITCPHCGPRAQAEFVYERTADSVVTPDMAPGEAVQHLFARANPRDFDEELWRHTHGCGGWLMMRRHRVSHVIAWTRAIGPAVLP